MQQNYGKNIPIVKLVIPYILGLYLSSSLSPLPLLPIVVIWALLLAIHLKRHPFNRRYWNGIALSGMFILMGYLGAEFQMNKTIRDQENLPQNISNWLLCLENESQKGKKTNKFQAKVLGYYEQENFIPFKGKAKLYLDKEIEIHNFHSDDFVLIHSKLDTLVGPKNPLEFDYRSYLMNQGIAYSSYVKKGNIEIIKNPDIGFNFLNTIRSFRVKLNNYIDQSSLKKKNKSVLKALTLGIKEDLNHVQNEHFSKAGAIHILAVSGLHVGLIFMILNQLLFFLKKGKRLKILKSLILISCLFTYALITGFSPSVIRATIMFSFLIIAKILFKNPNSYNTLAASALLILIIDPSQIHALGFQLSYAAVLGIITCHQGIYQVLKTKYWLINKASELVAVSISAQSFTLPLSLYYFHQFPSYFLLTNILVIPLVTFILYLGVAYLILKLINFEIDLLTWSLDQCLSIMNRFVEFISQLSYSTIKLISIDQGQMIIMFICIISLILFLQFKRSQFLFVSMFMVVGIQSCELAQNVFKEESITLYSISNSICIFHTHGNKHTLISQFESHEFEEKLKYHVGNHWNYLEVDDVNYLNINHNHNSPFLYINKGFITIGKRKFLILNDSNWQYCDSLSTTDCIILSDKKYWNRIDWKSMNQVDIVLSNQLNYYDRNELKDAFEDLGIDVIDLNEKSYTLTIE